MENIQTVSTQEVDSVGGWLITHWTQTWVTRVPLTQIDDMLQKAKSDAAIAQAKVDELESKKVELKADIDAAVAKQAAADAASEIVQANKPI